MPILMPWTSKPREVYEATYVLDTNILLLLYRVHPQSRTMLLSTLSAAQHLVWMPGQVAREFNKNRTPVIIEYNSLHRDLIDRIKSKVEEAISGQKQSTPYALAAASIARDSLGGMYSALEMFGSNYDCSEAQDPILTALESIYDNRVGTQYSESEFAERVTMAKQRVAKGMPPGLTDAKEKMSQAVNKDDPKSLEIANVYGDVMIWFQIMDYCAKVKPRHLILVTDDNKDDDWWRVQGGRYSIGPRLELQEELFNASGTTFNILSQRSFFQQCQEQYKFEISSAIDELDEAASARYAIWDEQIASVSKQINNMRHETFSNMAKICNRGEYHSLYGSSQAEIAPRIETHFFPQMIRALGMDWRLKALRRAYIIHENISDDNAIIEAHHILHQCLFEYFGCKYERPSNNAGT